MKVLYPRGGKDGPELVDVAGVKARYGIAPDQVPDFIALRGDPSDGIPGAKGIGEKTAGEILRVHDDLDTAIANAAQERPRVAAALRDQADELREFRKIATLQPISVVCPPDAPTDLRRGLRGRGGARDEPLGDAPQGAGRAGLGRARANAGLKPDALSADASAMISRVVRRAAAFLTAAALICVAGAAGGRRLPRRHARVDLDAAGWEYALDPTDQGREGGPPGGRRRPHLVGGRPAPRLRPPARPQRSSARSAGTASS